MKKLLISVGLLSLMLVQHAQSRAQWTVKEAEDWWKASGWFAGCNFIPSTAVNTLEMWQAETFDPVTIDRELGYAQTLGFTVIRVFIHPLVWQQDPIAFKNRMDQFLTIATSHKIKTMFVMFDDCWNPEGKLGPQPAPIPSVHNSQWVQSPGEAEYKDSSLYPLYKMYFLDIIGQFKDDDRVYLWDIYNEPGNSGHISTSLPLLQFAFEWARQADPSQPISSGIWNFGFNFAQLNNYQMTNSDVLTFHSYQNPTDTNYTIKNNVQSYGRPAICTEYMARPMDSKFQTHIPLFNEQNIGAINWGLVSGKTNTIFPWGSKEGDPIPKVWFHDIFYPNGTAFDPEEARVIKFYTLKQQTPIIE